MSINALNNALDALSTVIPKQEVAKQWDLRKLSQRGAFEILRYLLNCSLPDEKRKELEKCWKVSNFSKGDEERFKKTVLQEIKNLSTMGPFKIPVLRMTDMKIPNQTIFFTCCNALARYALSYQLSLFGFNAWTKSDVRQKVPSLEEISDLKSASSTLEKELEEGKRRLGELKASQKECASIVRSLMAVRESPDLPSSLTVQEFIAQFSRINDELHSKNLEKISTLKNFEDILKFLYFYINNNHTRTVLDGEELLKLIPFETKAFAEKENIPLFKEGLLNLKGLFEVTRRTLETEVRSSSLQELQLLLQILPPVTSLSNNLTQLENMEKQLKENIYRLRKENVLPQVKKEIKEEVDKFYIKIPPVVLRPSEGSKCQMSEPVFCPSKIDWMIKTKDEKQNRTDKKSRSDNAAAPSSKATDRRQDEYKGLRRRRSKSFSELQLGHSLLSSTKQDSGNFTSSFVNKTNLSKDSLLLRSFMNLSKEHASSSPKNPGSPVGDTFEGSQLTQQSLFDRTMSPIHGSDVGSVKCPEESMLSVSTLDCTPLSMVFMDLLANESCQKLNGTFEESVCSDVQMPERSLDSSCLDSSHLDSSSSALPR